MKKIFIFLFLLTLSFPLFAFYTIKGKVVDATTQSPLDFVNVALFKQNQETPEAGVVSDAKGDFLLPNVPKGKYFLRVSFVGYNSINLPLNVSDNELNIGNIKLLENSKTLSELEVIGQGTQMTFDIDKKVFTVDKNIASAGGSASDVLQNIPSVDVDGEGNVSLRNSSSVEVWINGKPSGLTADNRAQVLQQMPAESIDKVEVMTNPSAKFKPEGTSGIINIVLKKNRKAGYYGSLSAGIMYVDESKPTGTLGANINYSSSKIDAYLNIGYRAMDFKGGGFSNRFGLNGSDTTSVLNQTQTMFRGYSGLFGRGGIDYHLNDKHTLSISSFGMLGSGYSNTNTDYSFKNILTGNTRNYNRANTGDGTRPSLSVSLDYKYDIDKLGSNLLVDLTLSNHSRTSNEHIIQFEKPSNTKSSDYSQSYAGNNNEIEFKLDYTKKFSEKSRLELGLNSTVEKRESPSEAYDFIKDQEKKEYFNKFIQSEAIHAAYATFGSRIGNLSYQGGLRTEYFQQDWTNTYYQNNIQKTDIGTPVNKLQFFPSAFISYTLPKKDELQLNITRRIRRPHGRDINPFRMYSDSTNISYGNPTLLPEITTAFEFNYLKTWENHSLSSSAYYRFTDDVMQNVQYFNNNTMENTTMNVSKSSNIGLELVAKNRLLKIINLTSSLNLYYNRMDSSSYTSIYNPAIVTTIPEKELFSWNIRSMANIILGKNTFLQLSGDYSAPRLIAQGKETASYAFDLGLRQTFMNKNLSLNLMLRDMFNTRRRSTTIYGAGFYQKSESYMMGRMIGLTATYNFGNMKPKQTDIKKNSTDMNMEGGMD
jgi:outer membrane receptor protein involved in Fe transport